MRKERKGVINKLEKQKSDKMKEEDSIKEMIRVIFAYCHE